MIKVTVGLVNKTKLALEQTSKTVLAVAVSAKTKISSAIQTSKTELATALGKFYSVFEQQSLDSSIFSDIFTKLFGKGLTNTTQTVDTTKVDFAKTAPSQVISATDINTVLVTKVANDTFSLLDSTTNSTNKGTVSGLNFQDVFTRQVTFTRQFSDQLNLTDDINGASVDDNQTVQFFKNTAHFAIAEDIYKTAINKPLADQTQVLDTRYLIFGKPLVESIVWQDTKNIAVSKYLFDNKLVYDNHTLSVSKPLPETINLSDTFSSQVEYIRDFTNTIISSDSITGTGVVDDEQNVLYFKNLSSIVTVADTVLEENEVVNTTSPDSAGISDNSFNSIQKLLIDQETIEDIYSFSFTKYLSDAAAPVDEHYSSVFKIALDSAQLSDTTTNSTVKQLIHTANILEVFNTSTEYYRSLFSDVLVTDDINGANVDDDQTVQFFKNTTNVFSIQSIPTISSTKVSQDVLNLNSSGKILAQNYVDGASYFLEDYVGVSRTFV